MQVGIKGVSLPFVVCNHPSTPVQADPKGQKLTSCTVCLNESKTNLSTASWIMVNRLGAAFSLGTWFLRGWLASTHRIIRGIRSCL